MRVLARLAAVALLAPFVAAALSTIPIPLSGNGSLTHYDLPLGGYVAR